MSPKKKPGPREEHEAKVRKCKIFLINVGVYIALVLGVIASQAITMSDNLKATFTKVEIGQVAGAIIVAGVAYNRLESAGELEGKLKNVGRLLRNAFYQGFFWMSIVGAWW